MDDSKKKNEILNGLSVAVTNFDVEKTKKLAEEVLRYGIDPYEAIMEGLNKGMKIVGDKFEAKEYFLSELLLAGEAMKGALEVLNPHLKSNKVKSPGKVVIGTIKGDIHDIGKTIVATLLISAGFEVVDLGVDVETEKFIKSIKDNQADILAMSALLTTTMPHMEEVINTLKKEGIRTKLTIIVGGAPLTKEYAQKIGADLYASEAVGAVKKLKDYMKKN